MTILTTAQAAAELGISRRRVLALIQAKRLPAYKHGNAWIIEAADLERVRVRSPGRPTSLR